MNTLMIVCLLPEHEASGVQFKCTAKVIWEMCLVGVQSVAILPSAYSEYMDVSVILSYSTFHLPDTQ